MMHFSSIQSPCSSLRPTLPDGPTGHGNGLGTSTPSSAVMAFGNPVGDVFPGSPGMRNPLVPDHMSFPWELETSSKMGDLDLADRAPIHSNGS